MLTLKEVAAGTLDQRREVFKALSTDFLDRVREWDNAPFLKKVVGLVHDPDRKAFLELAELANDVGKLPDVNERIVAGRSVSVGYFDWSKNPNAKLDEP
ncbi:MAG: hypothetical protein IT380_21930 [Myxococcales bacterium]|nr:hypothetical protein [Myxococcales bacterium]